MDQKSELSLLLHAGTRLVDSAPSQPVDNLKDVLRSRLSEYYRRIGTEVSIDASGTVEEVQFETAQAALHIVEGVQHILDADDSFVPQDSPGGESAHPAITPLAIGTRDLAILRTLLSITFKWGIEPLLTRVAFAWTNNLPPSIPTGPRTIDPTTVAEDHAYLSSHATRLITLIFPRGTQGSLPQTLLTTTILNRHVTDILRPSIALGWLPKALASESMPTIHLIRPLVIRLLAILPPAQTIAALGAIVSDTSLPLPHVRKSCTFFLSKQLLRPGGVSGLCAAIFGDSSVSEDHAPLDKLEQVARVLTAVPAPTKPEEYFQSIIPTILELLVKTAPPNHRRAAAFTLSRLLVSDGSFPYFALVSKILLPTLHDPFTHVKDNTHAPTPVSSLSTLMTLLTNTDPSPMLISSLLSPIIAELYSLSAYLDCTKTSDPGLKESVRGLLSTWGRVTSTQEGIDTLWPIILGRGGDWHLDLLGEVRRLSQSEQQPSLSLFTPEDLRRADETGGFDINSNLLDLRPDPVHFVGFIKSIDRGDISSELFVKLLEAYREMKTVPDSDPLRTLLYLQLIIQMQSQLAGGDSAASVLEKPEHILSFIKQVLESATVAIARENERGPNNRSTGGLNLDDLRIVPEEEESLEEGDSDDETPESGGAASLDEEMTDTAINLLLSVLEANPNLSAQSTPVLGDISSLLEPLANGTSYSARAVAREARMVMAARLASTSAASSSKSTKTEDEENAQKTYQKALKLLQDPILPVRAHGLLLLRQLVSQRQSQSSTGPPVDPALVPAILSIFLQSIQDDDSYMFLNAVQGLAAMVDGFGKDVLRGLVDIYARGLNGVEGMDIKEHDMNTRIRMGEALGQVIRRCGDTLSNYVDILVPQMFNIVRLSHSPSTLRTSALSLLAECVDTSPLALLPYTVDLAEAMTDLLQVESVPAAQHPVTSRVPDDDKEKEQGFVTEDSTSTNSKSPPLRRAALHFLSLLLRTSIEQAYSSGLQIPVFSRTSANRMRTTLAYIASVDVDNVVRIMAKEVIEELEDLNQAILGME